MERRRATEKPRVYRFCLLRDIAGAASERARPLEPKPVKPRPRLDDPTGELTRQPFLNRGYLGRLFIFVYAGANAVFLVDNACSRVGQQLKVRVVEVPVLICDKPGEALADPDGAQPKSTAPVETPRPRAPLSVEAP